MHKILIVDTLQDSASSLACFLSRLAYESVSTKNSTHALDILASQSIDAVLLEVCVDQQNSFGLVDLIRKKYATPTIVISPYTDAISGARFLRAGASDYLTKPCNPQTLERTLRRAIGKSSGLCALSDRVQDLETKANLFESMGMSVKVQGLIHAIEQVSTTDLTVLLCGETGTGKELASRAIHNLSNRRNSPFIAIDCGAIPESLIESELFGHSKGSFTGADQACQGIFEIVQDGTLFLDEISSLPLQMQSRLIRVIESKEFRPVGGGRVRKLNARIIAASNQDMAKMIQAKEFRSDLYHRLNEYPVNLPPLRERMEDIPDLVAHFLNVERVAKRSRISGISKNALQLLSQHDWPGNVRELRNCVRHAMLQNMDQAGDITEEAFSLLAATFDASKPATFPTITAEIKILHSTSTCKDSCPLHAADLSLKNTGENFLSRDVYANTLNIFEAKMLQQVLAQTKGNRAASARLLGMDIKTFNSKIKNNPQISIPQIEH
jgi:DNA-binding NtrC family response regulator